MTCLAKTWAAIKIIAALGAARIKLQLISMFVKSSIHQCVPMMNAAMFYPSHQARASHQARPSHQTALLVTPYLCRLARPHHHALKNTHGIKNNHTGRVFL